MSKTTVCPIYLDGRWQSADSSEEFSAINPQTSSPLPERFPISRWSDCDRALVSAAAAFVKIRQAPAELLADFLDAYAAQIESNADEIVQAAHLETALPLRPRLAEVELPRTTGQLRQAAAAAREGSWAMPTIDSANNIRSMYAGIGPVWVLGPNNFPLAFNAVSGGDFAAAIAAGNPVIAQAHPNHPQTTRLLFERAIAAAEQTGLPAGMIQLLYRIEPSDGLRLAGDRRLGAIGFTGSRRAGLALKAAGDAVGKPVYAEMSSINPVVLLPSALRQSAAEIATQFCTSCTMGAGQFCTQPGLVLLLDSEASRQWIDSVRQKLAGAEPGTLFAAAVRDGLTNSVARLRNAGAQLLTGGEPLSSGRIAFRNTLMQVSAEQFLSEPQTYQTEMFGAASLIVLARDDSQLIAVVDQLEGNLTGTIYVGTEPDTAESARYAAVANALRPRVGRLIENKMPTGVAVSPAMNHGGPFPATSHPGFTAVGIPASIRRFAMLQCYDGVAEKHLPPALRNANPNGQMWRLIDGAWTRGDV